MLAFLIPVSPTAIDDVSDATINRLIKEAEDAGTMLRLDAAWEMVSFFVSCLPPVPHFMLDMDEFSLPDQALLGGIPTQWPNSHNPARLIDPKTVSEIADDLQFIVDESLEDYKEYFIDEWADVTDGMYGHLDKPNLAAEAYANYLEPLFIQLAAFYRNAASNRHGVLVYGEASGEHGG